MPTLNETLAFNQLPADVRAMFVGQAARRLHLPAGSALYKFTGFGVMPGRAYADMSPWWALETPVDAANDPGFSGHLRQAQAEGRSMLDYARDRFAVMLQWNSLGVPNTGLAKAVHITLKQPVYGFGGLCQRVHEAPAEGGRRIKPGREAVAPPKFRGGAYQVFIPNLPSSAVNAGRTTMVP